MLVRPCVHRLSGAATLVSVHLFRDRKPRLYGVLSATESVGRYSSPLTCHTPFPDGTIHRNRRSLRRRFRSTFRYYFPTFRSLSRPVTTKDSGTLFTDGNGYEKHRTAQDSADLSGL